MTDDHIEALFRFVDIASRPDDNAPPPAPAKTARGNAHDKAAFAYALVTINAMLAGVVIGWLAWG